MHKQPVKNPQLSRMVLLLRVVFVYVLLVCALGAVARNIVPPFGTEAVGSTLLLALQVLFYFLPVILALGFGLLFPPLLENFLRVLTLVFAALLSLSLVGYGLRSLVVRSQHDDASRSRVAVFQFADFSHRFFDTNKDGLIDKAEFRGKCTMEHLPKGNYALHVIVSQQGAPLAGNPVAVLPQVIADEKPRTFKMLFSFDPQPFQKFLRQGPLEVVLALHKTIAPSPREIELLKWCSLAPFLRSTSWGTADPLMQPQPVDLEIRHKVDEFTFIPL